MDCSFRTSADMSSDTEKDSQLVASHLHGEFQGDIEKQKGTDKVETLADSANEEWIEENHGQTPHALSVVLSRASTRTVDPGPPPDGGLRAWITGARIMAQGG